MLVNVLGQTKCQKDVELQQMLYAPAAWHEGFRRTQVISWISLTRRGRIFLMRMFCSFPKILPIWKRIQNFDAPSWLLWEERGRCNYRMIIFFLETLWGSYSTICDWVGKYYWRKGAKIMTWHTRRTSCREKVSHDSTRLGFRSGGRDTGNG